MDKPACYYCKHFTGVDRTDSAYCKLNYIVNEITGNKDYMLCKDTRYTRICHYEPNWIYKIKKILEGIE